MLGKLSKLVRQYGFQRTNRSDVIHKVNALNVAFNLADLLSTINQAMLRVLIVLWKISLSIFSNKHFKD